MTAQPSDSRDEAYWRDFLTRGRVWFGTAGEGGHVELTALGDVVNVAARLASAAGAGEILATAETAEAAGLDRSLERKPLELRGKHQATDVVTLRVGQ